MRVIILRTKKQAMADRHENDIANYFPNLRKTSASGAKDEKGDLQPISSKEEQLFLFECKSTQKESFSITQKLWEEVAQIAGVRSHKMIPALAIRFYGPTEFKTKWGGYVNLDPRDLDIEEDLVVIRKSDLLDLIEKGK
jgi:Holliday junction resolvase